MRVAHSALLWARRTGFSALLVVALLLSTGRAEAHPLKFLGPHPVAASLGGGYCYIEGPHFHAYAPDHAPLYARVDGSLVFTGDPTPFGYDGPHFTFYGHHPIPGAPDVYCYIDGPHLHPFEPPPEPSWKRQGDVTFYVGPFSPEYYKERPSRVRAYATIYAPYVAERPVVTVSPPPEWHGEVWVAPPAVPPPPGVLVRGVPAPPSVRVGVAVPPPPRITIDVPPPPSVELHVGAPPPPRVDVRVGAPPPPPGVVVVGGERERDEGWEHDRGRHRGWEKHDDEGEGRWKHGKWKEKHHGHDDD